MKKNYLALEKYYPFFLKWLTEHRIEQSCLSFEIAKNGMATMVKNEKGRKVYLHSKYNPDREALIFSEQIVEKFSGIVCVMGFGLGYHIKKIVENINFKMLHVVILNFESFKYAIDHIDLEEILNNPKVKLWFATDTQKLSDSLEHITESQINQFLIHESSLKCMKKSNRQVDYVIEEFVMRIKSGEKFKKTMEENFEVNKRNFDDFVNILYNRYIDANIYIVSAGPSLEKNVLELKNIDQRDIIICVASAVKVLIKNGIAIDYICMLESHEKAYAKQLEELDLTTPLIISATADKNAVLKYRGKKYIACQDGFIYAEDFAKKKGVECITTGGSVATMALDIAVRMNPKSILFVGQDLAYTNMHTHAISLNSNKILNSNSLRQVEGYYGGFEKTSKNLYAYRRWIQNRIKDSSKTIRFINATEGGAHIQGTERLSLRDAMRDANINLKELRRKKNDSIFFRTKI